tara:strand:- start:406 stop:723 length:318 start_codon:yes stop_codon:yes gene_type:complete
VNLDGIREAAVAIIVFGLFALLLYFTTAVRYEDEGEKYELLTGEVIDYREVRLDTEPRHHFLVSVPNGSVIKVYDFGQLNPSYRGPVTVSVSEGAITGKTHYAIK